VSSKASQTKNKLDVFRWILVVILISAGVAANFYFSSQPLPLRIVGWIVLSCVAIFVILQTTQGKRLWKFYGDARNELRKVTWPTRHETFQTTLIVILMVVALACILWAIDSTLMWLIERLTG